MTLSDSQIYQLVDHQKVLNFCLDQIIEANEAKIEGSTKTPYEVIALITIDNIVQLIAASNEQA